MNSVKRLDLGDLFTRLKVGTDSQPTEIALKIGTDSQPAEIALKIGEPTPPKVISVVGFEEPTGLD